MRSTLTLLHATLVVGALAACQKESPPQAEKQAAKGDGAETAAPEKPTRPGKKAEKQETAASSETAKEKAKKAEEESGKPAEASKEASAEEVEIDPAALAVFEPLPKVAKSSDNPVTEPKVKLGRMLYYDKRLSRANEVSCNTCHPLSKYGTDHKPVSRGHKDQKGTRNAPTVYNAAGQIAQFWDGRAEDVEEQAIKPLLNPVEMGMPSKSYVERVLKSIPEYVDLFKKSFPNANPPVTFVNAGRAIGAFERKLMTPGRFDAFLQGEKDALTPAEKKGLKTFASIGCTTCHYGPRVGGTTFQKLGLVKPWPNQEDKGRYEVTGKESDKMKFKVAILRNVAKTGPYFHDGSVKKLEKAIRMMAKHQLGRDLTDDQVASIKTFLEALTGKLPTDYIEKPELPPVDGELPEPKQTHRGDRTSSPHALAAAGGLGARPFAAGLDRALRLPSLTARTAPWSGAARWR